MLNVKLSCAEKLAQMIDASKLQVESAISLFANGASAPFIARYRKEKTQGLQLKQLRIIEKSLQAEIDLEDRKRFLLESLQKSNKLTADLTAAILQSDSKLYLDDLCSPYRHQGKEKDNLKKIAELENFAAQIIADVATPIVEITQNYVGPEKEFNDVKIALKEARQNLIKRFAENPDFLQKIREYYWTHAILTSVKAKNKQDKRKQYVDYDGLSLPVSKIPSYKALALLEGRSTNFLKLTISIQDDVAYGEQAILDHFNIIKRDSDTYTWLLEVIHVAWRQKIVPKIETYIYSKLRDLANSEYMKTLFFSLSDVLLRAPAGPVVTLGIYLHKQEAYIAVALEDGTIVDSCVCLLFGPQGDRHQFLISLAKLTLKYNVSLISIAPSSGYREVERVVDELIKMYPDFALGKVIVNDLGITSQLEKMSKKKNSLEIAMMVAGSIARRAQDPLLELAGFDLQDLYAGMLDVKLDKFTYETAAIVEDCLCAVGVDVNISTWQVLNKISGIDENLAKKIVAVRDKYGAFQSREDLREKLNLSTNVYQNIAGFLQIKNIDNVLDASRIHPEAYPIVVKILNDKQISLDKLIGNTSLLDEIKPSDYITSDYGMADITDILRELESPGKDPRAKFKLFIQSLDVNSVYDLVVGQVLEGVVTKIVNFGIFVDVGVYQDGLVHVSSLGRGVAKNLHAIVHLGDIVSVQIDHLDKDRKRIGLILHAFDKIKSEPVKRAIQPARSKNKVKEVVKGKNKHVFNTAMADALMRLREGDR